MDLFFDYLSHIFLFTSHEMLIIAIVSLGFWVIDREKFGQTIFILLFSMLVNTYLKSLWMVPLKPGLGDHTWSFPSGHMQTTTVFWGWLAWKVRRFWFSLLTLIIIGGMAWALQYNNYHDWEDIGAGIGFGILLIMAYYLYFKMPLVQKYQSLIGTVFGLLGFGIISLLPKHFFHVWIAEGALIGFSMGWFLIQKTEYFYLNRSQKFFKLCLGLMGLALIQYGSTQIYVYDPSYLYPFVKFFLVGLWVTLGTELTFRALKFKTRFLQKI